MYGTGLQPKSVSYAHTIHPATEHWYVLVLCPLQPILVFNMYYDIAQSIEGWLNICPSYLVYCQIWLNVPRDDPHFFNIFLWMITTLVASKICVRKHQSTLAMRLVIFFLKKFAKVQAKKKRRNPKAKIWTSYMLVMEIA